MIPELLYTLLLLLLIVRDLLQGDTPGIPLTLLSVLLAAVLLRERNERIRTDFINQLKSRRRELRNGGTVAVDGLLLRYDTVVVWYVLSVGTLFTNVTIRTRFRIYTGDAHPENIVCSAVSLLTGWWSITGPSSTIAAILSNLQGGARKPINLLIDAPLFEEDPPEPANS